MTTIFFGLRGKLWKTIWKIRGKDRIEAISGGRSHRGFYKNYIEAVLDDIKTYLRFTSQDVVLDIGCSGGYFIEKISRSVKLTIGVDSSFSMIETAKNYNQQSKNTFFVVSDANNLPFANNTFSRIYMYSVFMYLSGLQEAAKILSEIKIVSSTGARCFIGDIPDKNKNPTILSIIKSFKGKDKIFKSPIEIIGMKVFCLFSKYDPDELIKKVFEIGMSGTVLKQKKELQHSDQMFDLLLEIKN